ncbi:actin cortical patch SUR7/pH-response regulator pali [Camillea tinctor]|nr:actin cortical patch SUR7/pH-response regulator pali [Camillea tinctor]
MGESRIKPSLVIIPLLLSIVGFVLAMLALFAGTGPQQRALEDYHLIAINMSNFGHDLIASATSSSSEPTSTSDGSFWDTIESGLSDIGDDITDEINDIANDYADRIAEELGISQWYSLHIMTACEGDFAPNATSPGAWYNTTNCTSQQAGVQLNLTDILTREIDAGPLGISASDLPIPDAVTETVEYLNNFLLAVFILYVLGSGFSGLSFLACVVVLTLRRDIGRATLLANASLALLAALALAIGSAVATAISRRGVAEINDRGADAGISAIAGTKFMIISWVAFAVMFVALLFWAVPCCLPRRRNGVRFRGAAISSPVHGATEKKRARNSSDSGRGLLGMFRRRH